MENTTNNEPRDYIFIYAYDDKISIIENASSFKDAIYKQCKKEGLVSMLGNLLEKALKGFDNDDIDGIISLYNHFSDNIIYYAFLIDKQIYNGERKNK